MHCVIWEHKNGLIPEHLEIDHIDDDPKNNKIENLQLLTHQDNLLKAAKNRNYDFVADNHKNQHTVKVIDTVTNDVQVCPSLYSAGLLSGVNCGIIKMCCDKTNNAKSGISKKNNHKYTFEYTTDKPTIINKRHGRLYEADQADELNKQYM
ncbi:MAG TPA: HNH endonuclease signature motif containing protein, partial [Candidatus Dojkabacteria bacterium]|nr:HNH endonuclease signature motif containing protein [Candidatus Dojkabacteria bacterium]